MATETGSGATKRGWELYRCIPPKVAKRGDRPLGTLGKKKTARRYIHARAASLAGQEQPSEKISYVCSSSGSVGGCRSRRPRIAARAASAIHPYDESQRLSLTLANTSESGARISTSALIIEI